MRVLNTQQMREADRRTIADHGVPSMRLMEAAGRQVVTVLEGAFPALRVLRVAIISGRGNNGGDGFVVARLLADRGVGVQPYLIGRAADVKGDARTNLAALHSRGVPVPEIADETAWQAVRADVQAADVIVDALFGTGLNAPAAGLAAAIIDDLNRAGRPIVSIDLPSGVSADTSDIIGPAVRAAITVTLGAPKVPLVLPPAEALAGQVEIADIGIPPAVIAELPPPVLEISTRESLRALVTPRDPGAHKGQFGHVLVVAGSRGKTGAAFLAAMGALRSGAGLVTVATPASAVPIIAGLGAEYMTLPLDETGGGLVAEAAWPLVVEAPADVIAIGPGLGQSHSVSAFVRGVLDHAHVPVVVDADGLNACADAADVLRGRADRPVVITPHPGEMARLTGMTAGDVQRARLDLARAIAAERGIHVVLKGARTIVAAPDGRTFINHTGNPGMATGGTGDVLTGALAAWWAQLGDPVAAARVAVYLHGLAGDLAAAAMGESGMIAGDLLRELPRAAMELLPARRTPSLPVLDGHRAHAREP